ncbi:MAG: RIP metalloprotease RseP [Pseudomonadota bacterium]
MEFLAPLAGNLSSGLFIAASFLFALTVVVFIHELGHFQVARWCGVSIDTFSIGFGKEIIAFHDKHGTRWRIAWIPLGGYVKFMDDEGVASTPSQETVANLTEEQRQGAFHLKPLWQRAAIVAAGPIANFILAILIFAGLAMSVGVTQMEARVAGVQPGTPAEAAGFKKDDVVIEISGRKIDDFNELRHVVSTSAGRELDFVVRRDGEIITIKAAPMLKELDDEIAGKHSRPIIGIRADANNSTVTHEVKGPIQALGLGVEKTYDIITGTLSYVGDIFMQRQSAEQLGGVVRIADVAGKVASIGFIQLIHFTAFISVSIGLINLFPIPLLDGGHLVFYAIEAIRGKPLSDAAQEFSFRIGLAMILGLMMFGFWNDRGILANWLSISS